MWRPELSHCAAGICAWRQVVQQLLIDLSPGEGGVDRLRIDTAKLRFETEPNEGSDEFIGVA